MSCECHARWAACPVLTLGAGFACCAVGSAAGPRAGLALPSAVDTPEPAGRDGVCLLPCEVSEGGSWEQRAQGFWLWVSDGHEAGQRGLWWS